MGGTGGGKCGGATLMCSVDLPQGSGLSAGEALRTAVGLALRDLAGGEFEEEPIEPLDLPGQRLLVVDTRIRRTETTGGTAVHAADR